MGGGLKKRRRGPRFGRGQESARKRGRITIDSRNYPQFLLYFSRHSTPFFDSSIRAISKQKRSDWISPKKSRPITQKHRPSPPPRTPPKPPPSTRDQTLTSPSLARHFVSHNHHQPTHTTPRGGRRRCSHAPPRTRSINTLTIATTHARIFTTHEFTQMKTLHPTF